MRRMKILVISTLYPNGANPKHGIFVHHRMKQLKAAYPNVELKVIAPVPWFPFKSDSFGAYGRFSKAPKHEVIDGIEVFHPRYLVLPKVGMQLTPHTLRRAILQCARKIRHAGYEFDLIDGHYYFPDGVAIARVASELKVPFTVTARGTDINFIPQHFAKARQQIQQVMQQADVNLAVCQALMDEMIELGAPTKNAVVARNGVDLQLFQFADENSQRLRQQQLGLQAKNLILSVGHLIERKGHHLIVEAMQSVDDCELWILGAGEMQSSLNKQIEQLGLRNKVRLLGEMTQPEMIQYYQAADCLVLASSREGWANVLLEAMACGTAVVATKIWGTPEVLPKADQTYLTERSPKALAQAINQRLQNTPKRADYRHHAEQFSWQQTTTLLYQTFSNIITDTSNGTPHDSIDS